MKSEKLILWFDSIDLGDLAQVGGKNACLGEMRKELISRGIDIPDGFAITAFAYHHLLSHSDITSKISKLLSNLNTHDIQDLSERGERIRSLIYNAKFPDDLHKEITQAYKKLCDKYGPNTDVAVLSSVTMEDLPNASFAGQQETFLNIRGEDMLIDTCKKCFASLFTDRAISYRVDKGFDQMSVALSIGIQKMVRSDSTSSGIIRSIDTGTGIITHPDLEPVRGGKLGRYMRDMPIIAVDIVDFTMRNDEMQKKYILKRLQEFADVMESSLMGEIIGRIKKSQYIDRGDGFFLILDNKIPLHLVLSATRLLLEQVKEYNKNVVVEGLKFRLRVVLLIGSVEVLPRTIMKYSPALVEAQRILDCREVKRLAKKDSCDSGVLIVSSIFRAAYMYQTSKQVEISDDLKWNLLMFRDKHGKKHEGFIIEQPFLENEPMAFAN